MIVTTSRPRFSKGLLLKVPPLLGAAGLVLMLAFVTTMSPDTSGLLLPFASASQRVPGSGPDTDGDGMSDAFEIAYGFDETEADEDMNGTVDGQDDFDLDGLGNAAEELAGTNPNEQDTDDDGLLDGQELARWQ